MRSAIARSNGGARADLNCLAARLSLAEKKESGTVLAERVPDAFFPHMQHCLENEAGHTEALWLTAAVCTVFGDREHLAALSTTMHGKTCSASLFHYFAAISHLAAGNLTTALEAANKAAADDQLQVEARYLIGWISIHRQDAEGAAVAMKAVADSQDSPSCQHARAILGAILFHQGALEEAIQWWQSLDTPRRTAWAFDEPLQKAILLAGLQAVQKGQFENAADRFREAGKTGLRDRAIGKWIQFALFNAGRRLLHSKGPG